MRSGYVNRTGRYSNRVDERSLLYAERTNVFGNCPDNSSCSEMGAMECHAGDTHHHFDIRFYNTIFIDTSTENNNVDERLIPIPV